MTTAQKTTAKAADQIVTGDSIKFGKDDFRTVTAIEHKWGGIYATVETAKGTMGTFDLTQRNNRVAA